MYEKYKFLAITFKRFEIIFIVCLLFSFFSVNISRELNDIFLVIFTAIGTIISSTLEKKYSKKMEEYTDLSKVEFNQFHFDFEGKNEVDTEHNIETYDTISNVETYTERYHSENNEINVALLNIGVKNKELFEDTLGEKVARYLKAINDQDEKEIKDVCSGEIAERTIKSIKENDKFGYDLKIENIEIINSTLIDVIPIKKNPIIDIKVIMTIKESIVKDSEKATSTQSDAKVYKVRFNKKDKSQKDYKCDNCGAELSAITEICPYCRTNTEFIEERNWFITSIKEVI